MSSLSIGFTRYRKIARKAEAKLILLTSAHRFPAHFSFPRKLHFSFPGPQITLLVEANRDEQPLRGPRNSNHAPPRLFFPHSHPTPCHAIPSHPIPNPGTPPPTPIAVRRVYELKIKYCLFSKPEHGISNKAQRARREWQKLNRKW